MYEMRRYIAGATIDVYKLHSLIYGKNKKRAGRCNPTPESVKLQNELLAKDKAIRKVNHNFTMDDLHLIPTFKKEKRPIVADGRKIFEELIRKARKKYSKAGLKLKYFYAFGFLDKEEAENQSGDYNHNETVPHFHLIVNYIDIRIWTELWREYGRIMIFPLDQNSNYAGLVNYFFEHTKNNFRAENSPMKQRYGCSRNLIDPPPPKKKVVKADSWRETPKAIKGYYIDTDSIRMGVSEITGYPYQFYRMVKINPRE